MRHDPQHLHALVLRGGGDSDIISLPNHLEPVSNDFALTTEATERLLLSDTTSIWYKVI